MGKHCASMCEKTAGCIGIKHYNQSKYCFLMSESNMQINCSGKMRRTHWSHYMKHKTARRFHVHVGKKSERLGKDKKAQRRAAWQCAEGEAPKSVNQPGKRKLANHHDVP